MIDDRLFVTELAAVLAGDAYASLRALFTPAAGGPQIYAAQAGADVVRPTLVLNGDWVPYRHGRMGQLFAEVRSRQGDETVEAPLHPARVAALLAALFGQPGANPAATLASVAAAKAALRAALAERGRVELLDYGLARSPEATTTEDDLRTVLRVRCAWRFV